MSKQNLPPNTARLAITSLCNILRQHGITSLEPEMFRQAKFDGSVATPLWHILHNVVLVVLADCPSGSACHTALGRQWSQVSLELSGGVEFPPEGAALVIRQLTAWGAPAGLIQELGPIGRADPDQDFYNPHAVAAPGGPDSKLMGAAAGYGSGAAATGSYWPHSCRSRPLLLALGWLVVAAGLFERRIMEIEPGLELRRLLPPYPQDACVSPAVQAAYHSAAQEAKEHVHKLLTSSTSTGAAVSTRGAGSRSGGTVGGPFAPPVAAVAAEALWAEVETAAQRAVMLYGRFRTRLVAIQTATDCRNRLAHSLWSRQAVAAPSSRPLTPYELQLCAQPGSMQRHMDALESTTLALLEQQELAAHGALFFEWLGSVLDEEHKYQQERQHRHQQKQGTTLIGRLGASAHRHAGRAPDAAGEGITGGGALASLQQLPYIGSDAGARLAANLQARLAAAVQAAELELNAARRRADDQLRQGGGCGPHASAGSTRTSPYHHQEPPPPPAVTLQHFLALAEEAVSEHQQLPGMDSPPYDFGDRSISSGAGGDLGGDSNHGATGLPLLFGGNLNSNLSTACETDHSDAWRLPNDLAEALDVVHLANQRRRRNLEEEGARFQQLRYAILARYDFSGGGGDAATAVTHGPPSLASAGGPAISASSETQRLLGLVLATARPLARTRAANKAVLLAALEDLPEGYIVVGL